MEITLRLLEDAVRCATGPHGNKWMGWAADEIYRRFNSSEGNGLSFYPSYNAIGTPSLAITHSAVLP